jgi:hypothetical protein
LDQNIQNVAILINCSPQIVNAAIDLEEHFIKMPLVPRSRRFSAQVVRINLAELEAPFSDRLIGESDTAHRQHFFNIAEAQGEAEVQQPE